MVVHLLKEVEEKFFLKKYLFFTKYTLFAEKKILYEKKVFILKNNFFTEKNINKNVKNIYLISEIYYYTENVCVSDKTHKSFLNIYSFRKK